MRRLAALSAVALLLVSVVIVQAADSTLTLEDLRLGICRHHPEDQLCASPGASPTSTPSPTAAPTSSPIPTIVPTPQPTPAPSAIVGYGSGTTGGTRITTVSSLAQLKTALGSSGNLIRLSGSGVWDGTGGSLSIPANTTLDGNGSGIIFKNVWLKVRASNVILRDLRIRSGDAVSADADAISINGGSGGISRIVLDHVEAIWAPDVGGVTILNNVTDVTVQHSIIGVGLTKSSHPESTDDLDGHNLAFNIVGLSSTVAPKRVTVYRNLILNAQGRNPRVQGGEFVDLVNNAVYNYDESPQGNPRGLNMVSNVLRWGPAPQAAGLGNPEAWAWKTATSGDYPNVFGSSVYLSGNVADGFTLAPPNAPASVLRASPYGSLSVTPESTTGLLTRILSEAGPRPIDNVTARWLNETSSRTGVYFNGAGFPPPNPYWN